MDVLNTTALPQSTEHFHLLLLVYNIVMAFLFPYLALVVGSVVTSVIADRRASKSGRVHLGWLARRLAGIGLPDRTTFVFLAVLPSLVVVFLFMQMFQATPAMAAGFAALGALLLVAGGIAGFVYKLTFTIDDVITLARGDITQDATDPVTDFVSSTRSTHQTAGVWAAWLLIAGALCIVGASTIGLQPADWQSVDGLFAFLFSGDVWLDMLGFVAAAAGMTGATLLFSRYVWHPDTALSGGDDDLLRRSGIRLAAAGLLAIPIVLLLGVAGIPATSVNGWVYALLAFSFAALGLGLLFLYAFVKDGRAVHVSLMLALLILALIFDVTKNQVALHIATRDHAARLAVVYDKHTTDLRASLGVKAKQLSGEDIYAAKCSACHLFDQKKVGPPYRQVLPKYAGRKNALVAFVLNPVKMDPAYPSMPSQGLKPSEADSIVTYLLNKVGVKAQ
jgi:cytochrome c